MTKDSDLFKNTDKSCKIAGDLILQGTPDMKLRRPALNSVNLQDDFSYATLQNCNDMQVPLVKMSKRNTTQIFFVHSMEPTELRPANFDNWKLRLMSTFEKLV